MPVNQRGATMYASTRVTRSTSHLELEAPGTGRELKSPRHRPPPSRVSKLPVEILDHIFQSLTLPDLFQLLLVNSSLHFVALRILYRSISFLRPTQSIACMRCLCRNPILPALVRELEVVVPIRFPTGNVYRLLHMTLKNMTGLVSLSLSLSNHYYPAWILNDCTFSLKKFTTSIPCDASLSRFLDTQPHITDLSLRGFPKYTYSTSQTTLSSSSSAFSNTFTLLPGSLPRLTHFHVIHAGPSILTSVSLGRPLQNVSIPLFADSAYESLDALGLASCTIRRLRIMSFDRHSPDYLLPQVAKRFPELEALDIVILMAQHTMVT